MRRLLPMIAFAAASCTPGGSPIVSQLVPERPATLLRRLALDVPADVARLSPLALREAAAAAPVALAPAPAFVASARSLADAERAQDCLTTAIYHEARSEGEDGQRAVAQVVLNRVRDRAFPASVCGVVFQGAHRRTGCQFSFTCDGSMRRPRDANAWARAGAVAAAALAGSVYAPVGSATHFHTSAIRPWWAPSLTRLGHVGAHVFYRWPSAMERALAFRQSYAGFEPVIGRAAPEMDDGVAGAIEMAHGVTIHRGAMPAAGGAALGEAHAVAADMRAAPAVVAGVRVHRGVEPAMLATSAGSAPAAVAGVRIHRTRGDQASQSPMPIEARAAAVSLETTG